MLETRLRQVDGSSVRGDARARCAICLVLTLVLGLPQVSLGDTSDAAAPERSEAEVAAAEVAALRAQLTALEGEVKALQLKERELRAARVQESREYTRLMQVIERKDPKVKAMRAEVQKTRESLARQQRELDAYLQNEPSIRDWNQAQQITAKELRETPQRRVELLAEMTRLRTLIYTRESGNAQAFPHAQRFSAPPARVETTDTANPGETDRPR